MIAGVADTHTALWYLFADPRLSATAKAFIDQAAVDRSSIEISPISLAEIVYLVEKNRIPTSALEDLEAALENDNHVFKEAPFTKECGECHASSLPRGSSRLAGSGCGCYRALFGCPCDQQRPANSNICSAVYLVGSSDEMVPGIF